MEETKFKGWGKMEGTERKKMERMGEETEGTKGKGQGEEMEAA